MVTHLFVIVCAGVSLCKPVAYGADAMFCVEVVGSDISSGAAIAIELVLFPVLEFWGAVNGFVCNGYSILFSRGVGSFSGYVVIWSGGFRGTVYELLE